MNTNDLLLLAKWAEPDALGFNLNQNYFTKEPIVQIQKEGYLIDVFAINPNTIEPLWLANKDAIFEWWNEIWLQKIFSKSLLERLMETQSAEQRADVMVEWLKDTGQINE